jgi:DNA-binding transcriptional MerR regulator
MLRIGDFSQLAQVSIRTLRHYDELGLLKPASIDRFTDYRYYTIEQLPRLNRILALKDLGFSLEQIKRVLDDNLSVEQLQGMLMLKQAEIAQQMQAEQERLTRVADRLKRIEQEGAPPPYDVIVKHAQAQTILSERRVVPTVADMKEYRCAMSEDIYTWLDQQSFSPTPPELVLYHTREYREHDLDIEMAIGIPRLPRPSSLPSIQQRLTLYELPAMPEVASVIHHGRLVDVGQAMIALFTWMEANGYQSYAAYRELHLFGREDDHDIDLCNIVVEIQVPIEKRR